MSTSPPGPLSQLDSQSEAPHPVIALPYDSLPQDWIPKALRLIAWMAVISGSGHVLAALADVVALINSKSGDLFAGPAGMGWWWGTQRILSWVLGIVLTIGGVFCFAGIRAARWVLLAWGFGSLAVGMLNIVMWTLLYMGYLGQTSSTPTTLASNVMNVLAWVLTMSAFPAIVLVFLLSARTAQWFRQH